MQAAQQAEQVTAQLMCYSAASVIVSLQWCLMSHVMLAYASSHSFSPRSQALPLWLLKRSSEQLLCIVTEVHAPCRHWSRVLK